jgi:uncharacterized PurR-regulated membrane protein YhhQ (DUF165 family)
MEFPGDEQRLFVRHYFLQDRDFNFVFFQTSTFFVGSFMAFALSEKVEIIRYTRIKVTHRVHWEEIAHSPVEKIDTLSMSRQ